MGGTLNTSSTDYSFIGGGKNNYINVSSYSGYCSNGGYSVIAGGENNILSSCYGFIGSGCCNSISAYYGYSSILGGSCNTISNCYIGNSSILGGSRNLITGYGGSTSIAGGFRNTGSNPNSFIGAGRCNSNSGYDSIIGAGINNCLSSNSSAIVAGYNNCVSDGGSFIGAGCNNTVSSYYLNNIVGGHLNKITGYNCNGFIGAGCKNLIDSVDNSSIVGGVCNTASAACSGILGGECNYACETESFIIGSNLVTTASCTTFVNNLNISGSLADSDGNLGSSGQILSSTGTGLNWIDNSGGGGSDSDWYDGTTYISSSVEIRVDQTISGSSGIIIGTGITNAGSEIFSIGDNNTQCSNSNFNGFFSTRGSEISGSNNVIVGGSSNELYVNSTGTIVGGYLNCIKPTNGQLGASYSTMIGGLQNKIESPNRGTDNDSLYGQFIGGGFQNIIHTTLGNGGEFNSIIGGASNRISGSDTGCAFIGGGQANAISGSSAYSAIIGGLSNCILDHACSFIIGSNLTSDKACYTFMNNLDVEGTVSASMFSGSFVGDGFVSSSAVSPITTQVTEIVTLNQTTYDGLTPSSNVLYVIV